jgi:serine protease DegQ
MSASIRQLAFTLAAVAPLLGVKSTLAQAPAIATVPAVASGDRPSLAPLLKHVTPAVVNIAVTSTAPTQANPLLQDPFFRRFFGAPDQIPEAMPRQSVGSGVIVDGARGFVLTNHHVVADADEIVVTLTDRRTVNAELVGSDEATDVAVLRISAENLTALPLADSSKLEVGDFVIAIGDPFGLGQTVTSGIVSALGRSGISAEGYQDFIQTDASINPGNSGGALVDLDGRLVGINTAIISPAGGNVGIGFAIPSNMANAVMRQLVEYGEVRRGRLGVLIQTVSPDLADALDLRAKEGAIVTQVEPGSAAARSDIQAGDVIVRFKGDPVRDATDLRNKVGLSPVGTTVPLTIVRDGRERQVNVSIEAAEPSSARAPAANPDDALAGAEFRDLTPQDPRYGEVQGAVVARVDPSSRAARRGLAAGDIVVAVNRTRVTSAAELAAALRDTEGTVALEVVRGEARIYIVVR